jgi:hypothetical protein
MSAHLDTYVCQYVCAPTPYQLRSAGDEGQAVQEQPTPDRHSCLTSSAHETRKTKGPQQTPKAPLRCGASHLLLLRRMHTRSI